MSASECRVSESHILGGFAGARQKLSELKARSYCAQLATRLKSGSDPGKVQTPVLGGFFMQPWMTASPFVVYAAVRPVSPVDGLSRFL